MSTSRSFTVQSAQTCDSKASTHVSSMIFNSLVVPETVPGQSVVLTYTTAIQRGVCVRRLLRHHCDSSAAHSPRSMLEMVSTGTVPVYTLFAGSLGRY